jgi:hypothetical protein
MPEHENNTTLDAEHIRGAIQRYAQTPGPRKKSERRRLSENTEFLSLLQRAIIAHDPPLGETLSLSPSLLFKALSLNMPDPEAIQKIIGQLRVIDSEHSRPLSVALVALLLSSGYSLPEDRVVEVSDTPLPGYAIDTFTGAFAVIDGWLQDDSKAEYKKRKLAALIIRSLPELAPSSEFAISAPLTLVKRLRAAHVDPSHFADQVRTKWIEHVLRLPHQARAALACLIAETSDGFQTRLWDDVALGPLPTQPSSANADLNAPNADPAFGFNEAPPVIDVPLGRHESQLKASPRPAIQAELPRDHEHGKSCDQEAPDDLSLVTGLHAQLGKLLEGFNSASQAGRQLREANEQLASSRAAADEARRLTELEVAKSAELKASLERANTREEQNLSDLAKLRGSVALLQKGVDSSEDVIKELRANIAQLQGDLEEAARARILFGEQRGSEVRNGLREKITHEVSGLPSLGPDLGEEHFAMVRVRFKNLLKLLAENDICAPLPRVVAR